MLSRAHWEHGLTLQDTKTSHFGHTLCMLCKKALLSQVSGKVGIQLLKKNQPQNSTQCLGMRQEEAAEQHIYHLPTWEKSKPISSPRRAQPRAPDGCWANMEPQQSEASYLLTGTPNYTEQTDAGHCRQNWDIWTWWVPFLHFLTASNIAIVTHNTREYNCCSDYLQPLH